MEGLLYVPPRAQVAAIVYGIAVGTASRVAGRGIHWREPYGLLNFRRSSWSCHFVLFYLIDNLDASCRFDSDRHRQQRDDDPGQRGRRSLIQRVGRQPLFAPAADSTINFTATIARESALSGTSSASSNAPNPTGIKALLPKLPS